MDDRSRAVTPVPEPVPDGRGSVASRTNGKAIASLVLGIVGVTGVPFVASVIAIVLGHIARREIAARGEEGRGLATAGIILGWVGAILAIAGALIVGAFFATTVATGSTPSLGGS